MGAAGSASTKVMSRSCDRDYRRVFQHQMNLFGGVFMFFFVLLCCSPSISLFSTKFSACALVSCASCCSVRFLLGGDCVLSWSLLWFSRSRHVGGALAGRARPDFKPWHRHADGDGGLGLRGR